MAVPIPGKENAPASGPEVTSNERSAVRGVFAPWSKVGLLGDCPRATRAWITSAVEFGSDVSGLAVVFGDNGHPPSESWALVRKLRAFVDTGAVSAPCAARPWIAYDVVFVSSFGNALPMGSGSHGVLTLSGSVQPPSVHCWSSSHVRDAVSALTPAAASAASASP